MIRPDFQPGGLNLWQASGFVEGPEPQKTAAATQLEFPLADLKAGSRRHHTARQWFGERPGIRLNEGFNAPKKDPSMSLSPDALATTISRDIGLSYDLRLTLTALIVGLISARTVGPLN